MKCGVTAFGVVQTSHVESVENIERSHRLTNSKPREVRRTHLLVRDQREGVRSHGPLRLVVHVVLQHVVRFDLLHRRFAQLAPHVLGVEDQSGPPGVSWRSGVSGVSQLAGMGRRSREERRCDAVRCVREEGVTSTHPTINADWADVHSLALALAPSPRLTIALPPSLSPSLTMAASIP